MNKRTLTNVFNSNYEIIVVDKGNLNHESFEIYLYVNHTLNIVVPQIVYYDREEKTLVGSYFITKNDLGANDNIKQKLDNVIKRYNEYLHLNRISLFLRFLIDYLNVDTKDAGLDETIKPPIVKHFYDKTNELN